MSERCFPRNSGYRYGDGRIAVFKISSEEDIADLENAELAYIDGARKAYNRDVYLELENLEAGIYMVFADIDFDESTAEENRTYVITAYADFEVNFTIYDHEVATVPGLIRAAGLACLRAEPEGLNTKEIPGAENCKVHRFTTNFLFNFTIYENDEEDKTVIEKVTFDPFVGCELYTEEGGNEYEVSVQPGEKLIILNKISQRKYNYQYTYASKIEMGDDGWIQQTM